MNSREFIHVNESLREIGQRLVRIETKVSRLMVQAGLDPRTAEEPQPVKENPNDPSPDSN